MRAGCRRNYPRSAEACLHDPELVRLAPLSPPRGILVFEATSSCDRTLRSALHASGIDARRVNPLHAWHFARSLNLAKTDRVDAAMLARLGAERSLEGDPARDRTREDLRELTQRRDQLKRMEVQEKNRRAASTLAEVARDIRGELRNLARRLLRIEAAIKAHLERSPALAASAGLLRSLPGIGPVAGWRWRASS